MRRALLSFLLFAAPFVPCAQAGPGVSGGGDFRADPKASAAETRAAIHEARRVLPFVWKALEAETVEARAKGLRDEAPISRPMMNALFPWPKPGPDVYALTASIELLIQEEGPCRDGQGAAKAASAFPFESKSICFSIPWIVRESTRANLLRRVTALLAHEVAHKLGLREEAPALALEKEISRRLPADPLELLQSRHAAVRAAETADLAGLRRLTTGLRKDVEAGAAEADLCLSVGILSGASARTIAHGNFEPYLLAFHRPNYQAEAKAIAFRGAVLPGYCRRGAAARNLSVHDPVLSILALKPRSPVVGDRRGLIAEVDAIEASLAKLEKSVTLNERLLKSEKNRN